VVRLILRPYERGLCSARISQPRRKQERKVTVADVSFSIVEYHQKTIAKRRPLSSSCERAYDHVSKTSLFR
jgi:hypothetical protein